MSGSLRRLAAGLTPPVVSRALQRRSPHVIRFEDDVTGWDDAVQRSTGYDEASILQSVRTATEAVLRGGAAFERDGVLFAAPEYRWPVLGALLAQAARDGSLRVLDFGGSLGSTFWQYRHLLEGVSTEWAVVEQPAFVAAGRALDQHAVTFHETIAEAAEAVQPNAVLLSSVLQYLPAPHATLSELTGVGARTLVLDRTTMTDLDEDRASVQVVPASIYSARYPAWLLSRRALLADLEEWTLLDEFAGIEPATESSSGVPIDWLGMSFVRP